MEGQELASGLYVHGGNGDENLFLIDGTPLYQINHAIGLFSSFNTDVVKTSTSTRAVFLLDMEEDCLPW